MMLGLLEPSNNISGDKVKNYSELVVIMQKHCQRYFHKIPYAMNGFPKEN